MTIIQIDTAAAVANIGPTTTPAQYLEQQAIRWLDSYKAQHGSPTRDAALQAALDAAIPDSTGRVGVRKRIRDEAIRRKTSGGFLPTLPAGNAKWLPSSYETMAVLAAYASAASALPAGIDIQALDGTAYALTKVRVTSALDAFAVQMAAIDAAEKAALAAQAANRTTFDFSAIVWPAIYTA